MISTLTCVTLAPAIPFAGYSTIKYAQSLNVSSVLCTHAVASLTVCSMVLQEG